MMQKSEPNRMGCFLLVISILLCLVACSSAQPTITSTVGWEYHLDQPLEDTPNRGYGESLWGKAPDSDTFEQIFRSDIGTDYMEYTVSEEKVYMCFDTSLYVMDPDGKNRDCIYQKCGGFLYPYDGYLYSTKTDGSYPTLIRISLDTKKVEETEIPVRSFSITDNGTLDIQTDKNRTTFASGEYQIDDLTWK